MALARGRGASPHVPMIFFLPFLFIVFERGRGCHGPVDASAVDTDTVDAVDADAVDADRLATKTPNTVYVGDDR